MLWVYLNICQSRMLCCAVPHVVSLTQAQIFKHVGCMSQRPWALVQNASVVPGLLWSCSVFGLFSSANDGDSFCMRLLQNKCTFTRTLFFRPKKSLCQKKSYHNGYPFLLVILLWYHSSYFDNTVKRTEILIINSFFSVTEALPSYECYKQTLQIILVLFTTSLILHMTNNGIL